MEPMLIVAAIGIGAVAATISGALARRTGFLAGAILPALMIGFTVYSNGMTVHPEGRMGQGMLVVFILIPLSVVITLGWAVGLWLRTADKRRQTDDR
ncbi:MAG: hypothetical protein MUE52_03485 [Tabrizicola sp.]|jgi:hypothetical protein|nr:hypothetical protein [Tabrizicola sp.]